MGAETRVRRVRADLETVVHGAVTHDVTENRFEGNRDCSGYGE
jgi:hypothetical protein